MGSQVERTHRKAGIQVKWGLADPETKDSKPLAVRSVGVPKALKSPSLTDESVGEAHGMLEHTQSHASASHHVKGQNPLVGSKKSDERRARTEQEALFPL